MSEQKQVQDGGHATFSVKVTQAVYDLVNILCEGLAHGTNGNDLFRMFIQAFIESAKHDGPLSSDMQYFMNLLRLEPGWHKAFNFADITSQMEVAQLIMILQQQGRKGFGLVMIDKPWMGEPTETRCVDDILERVVKVSMPGLYRRLDQIGQRLCCTSIRETLTLLSEYMNDSLDKEEDMRELPGYGQFNDAGRAVEYGRRTRQTKTKTPDSIDLQQKIVFDDYDREVADYEAKDWEGEHRGNADDGFEYEGFRPFDQEP